MGRAGRERSGQRKTHSWSLVLNRHRKTQTGEKTVRHQTPRALLLPEPHEALVNHVSVSAFKVVFRWEPVSVQPLCTPNLVSPFNKTPHAVF